MDHLDTKHGFILKCHLRCYMSFIRLSRAISLTICWIKKRKKLISVTLNLHDVLGVDALTVIKLCQWQYDINWPFSASRAAHNLPYLINCAASQTASSLRGKSRHNTELSTLSLDIKKKSSKIFSLYSETHSVSESTNMKLTWTNKGWKLFCSFDIEKIQLIGVVQLLAQCKQQKKVKQITAWIITSITLQSVKDKTSCLNSSSLSFRGFYFVWFPKKWHNLVVGFFGLACLLVPLFPR